MKMNSVAEDLSQLQEPEADQYIRMAYMNGKKT